jgi:choline dehydrogenase
MFSPRGKVLGGSSSINGLVYIRGQPEDYDGWEVPGWSYTELLPYFRKSQNQQRGASSLHGAGGPIGVSDMERHELADAFIESAAAIGVPRNHDFNGDTQEGTGYYQCTTWNGRRASTAVGYLREAEKRPNLTVLTDALVLKVVFDRKKAVAIQYRKDQQALEAKAKREIILCGGSFNSPQLLQLSGVGPGELLQRHGIPVVIDAPEVGEQLQDHFYGRTFWRCTKPITLNDDMASLFRQAKIGLQWLLLKRGPLTIAAGYAAAFVRTRPELKRPDAQIYFINFSTAKRGGVLHPFSGFTLSVSQLQVESRGSVRIRSADPAEPPAIRYNYLATENDRRVMIEGIRWIRRIAAAKPLADYIVREEFPGTQAQTDDELLAFCRESGDTVFHPTSTCRMGTDERSVVDSQLRVKGLQGLRVVDASVMPAVVSGNTNAAVIAIAEKAADLIANPR